TRFSRDWSSDVCSSDLEAALQRLPAADLDLVRRLGLERRRTRHDADRAERRVLSEQRALRTSQHFDALEIDVVRPRLTRVEERQIGRASCRERVGEWAG